jgi:N-terminal acetyltransferase B complex non-catalytic subunit
MQSATKEWLLAEASVIQFEYLLFISMKEDPVPEAVEAVAKTSLELYGIAAHMQDDCASDIACIAIMSLLVLSDVQTSSSDYAQWQAAMLLRHILRDQATSNSRQLALLSTRVHLDLGLGTIGAEHYSYAKVKEMLNDTTSWILLSRISQSHPFDSNGVKGFSADEELAKVIASIEKMEARTGDFLYRDLQELGFDTAFELIDLKRKARFSLTKNTCMIERRRIARLNGQRIEDRQLDLDVKGKSEHCHSHGGGARCVEIREIGKPSTSHWVLRHLWIGCP